MDKQPSPGRDSFHRLSQLRSLLVLPSLTLSIVLASLLCSVSSSLYTPAAHAASATLQISPTSKHYSPLYSVITVQGANYGANETVNVYWNYTGPGTGTLETTATTDSTGAFSAIFETPLASTGTYTIAGVGQQSGLVATGTFQLLPLLTVEPHGSGPNTALAIIGNAFGTGETVNIYWNYTGPGTGLLLASATGDATGSFTTTANVPAKTKTGHFTIAGVGQTTNTVSQFPFTVIAPLLALAPVSGAPLTNLTVSAYGFTGDETVNFYWKNGTTPIASGPTNNYGYIVSSFTVPAGSSAGNVTVKAVGQTSNLTITNTFTVVAPASNVSLTKGPVGVTEQVTGQGYAPGETVNLLWNYHGPGTGQNVASVTTDYDGAFSASFAVPFAINGSYVIAAVGASSNTVTKNNFTIGNGLAVSPVTNAPGQSVTVNGTGYKPNVKVKLYWDSSSGLLLASVIADTHGNILTSVNLPANATPGSHSIVGVGQKSGKTFTAPVTIDTAWGDFGFDPAHQRENNFENSVSTSNVANLKLKWSATTPTNLKASPVYANDLVYISTNRGMLNAYNATTGALQWQFNSGTNYPSESSPLVDPATGLVFFGLIGHDGFGLPTPFYALDARTGALKWSLILAWDEYDFPTVANRVLYIGVSNEGKKSALYALDETTGHINWQRLTDGGIWGAIGVDTTRNMIFSIVGNPADTVTAFDATTGKTIWQYDVPVPTPDADPGSGVTIANGLVYIDSKNGSVYALNESSGTLNWTAVINTQSIGDVSTQAVSVNGMLYVGSLDNNLYAFNATTGVLKWKTPTGGGIDSSPAVANGIVYVASFDGSIYAMDATTGTTLWSYATGSLSFSSPIMANGWLYCGSTNGNLYAFHL